MHKIMYMKRSRLVKKDVKTKIVFGFSKEKNVRVDGALILLLLNIISIFKNLRWLFILAILILVLVRWVKTYHKNLVDITCREICIQGKGYYTSSAVANQL